MCLNKLSVAEKNNFLHAANNFNQECIEFSVDEENTQKNDTFGSKSKQISSKSVSKILNDLIVDFYQ